MKASVAELVRLPGVWRGGELEQSSLPSVPTGHAALDAELPGGGWPAGTLTEVLHDAAGIGEVSFLAGTLARASAQGRLVPWIAPPHLPYAPALLRAGILLERCVIVRPANREDALWAAEQALKSGACGAVLLWMERHPKEYSCLRRLQMAAHVGRSVAVLFRSTAAESHASPAHLRVSLSREAACLRVRLLKRRGPPLAGTIQLDLAPHPSLGRTPAAQVPSPRVPAPAARPAFRLVAR